MKKTKIAVSFIIISLIIGVLYFAYKYFFSDSFFRPSNSYVYQVKRSDVDDDYLLKNIGKDNISELSDRYVRIRGTYSVEEKLIRDNIKYILIPDDFVEDNGYGVYIVKISDNYIEPKLQEISKSAVVIQRKYDWASRKVQESSVVIWAAKDVSQKISQINNVEYVLPYKIPDRIDPVLVETLKGNNVANDIKIQIYDVSKYRKELKNDPFYKKAVSKGIKISMEPRTVSFDYLGTGKEYSVEGNLSNLIRLIRISPEIVRVFK